MHEQDYGTRSKTQKVFEATIELPYHASQKNSKRIFKKRSGQLFLGSTSRVQTAKIILLRELQKRARTLGICKPFDHRLRAVLLFGFPRTKFFTKRGLENQKLGDCSNLAQIVEDALQKSGIIKDDCFLAPIYVDRIPGERYEVHIQLWDERERTD